ncbi:MAG TPA: hypothetical protein VL093_12730 [Flavipsychrobacter sp.]|jgi:hypothetical protein|nr:hypothetical protein [Flavipsychrobacter sp.]
MPFETNVFINCPFDDDYTILIRPLLFTVVYLDFEPKISQTISSSNIRINQIKGFIRESRFSIHDLSRSRPLKKNELPRFNMPYELGLDIGCAEFGSKKFRQKKTLILETEKYHYQKVISDISGQDIESHSDDPATLIQKIRNWFSSVDDSRKYPSPSSIWIAYTQFYEDITKTLLSEGFTSPEIEKMTNSDFIKFAKDWIKRFKAE